MRFARQVSRSNCVQIPVLAIRLRSAIKRSNFTYRAGKIWLGRHTGALEARTRRKANRAAVLIDKPNIGFLAI
jgi:hypothetical protein